MRRWLSGCLSVLVGAFLLIQLVPVSWPQPASGKEIPAPDHIKKILRRHCYECHSSRAERPWYAGVAPISWWISYDVNQGVSRLDFSNWNSESSSSARYKIAHSGHRLRQGKEKLGDMLMPPSPYLWFHPGSKLSQTEIKQLLDWAQEHGMNLDGSDQRLRLRSTGSTEAWPFLVAATRIETDEKSRFDGELARGVTLKPLNVEEFDPKKSSKPTTGGRVTGLNRYQGHYQNNTELDQALLYVDGSMDCQVGGIGAVVATGSVRLRLKQPSQLFILADGEVELTGGGPECRLAVISSKEMKLKGLEAWGTLLASSISVNSSVLAYDRTLVRGSIPLGTARRTVLLYCDRDGELMENDRRMEVLLDAGVFTLHDPEYEVTKYAKNPQSALKAVAQILELDPAMSEEKWVKLGFKKKWWQTLEEFASNESWQARVDYAVADWVQKELDP